MNGVNRVVHNLATAQKELGVDVLVWGITKSAMSPDEGVLRKYDVAWFLPTSFVFGINSKLKTAIKKQKNTVFHLHGGFIPVFFSLSLLLKKLKKEYFITPHGTYTVGAMSNNSLIKKWYFTFLEKKLIVNAKSVQCLGHAEESDLVNICQKAQITLIPNGQNWDELTTSKITKPTNKFIIGYCGRITKWQKGLDILIEAFTSYKKELSGKGELHLIGDGEYYNELKHIAKENEMNDFVIFYGPQFGEEKIELMKKMSVFVHTSRNEGLPTAVIEATALGVPCIVSEMTSMDRYIKDYDAGWALSSLNPNEVAKTFKEAETAFLNGSITTLGKNAERLAKESFDWSIIAKKSLSMYNHE